MTTAKEVIRASKISDIVIDGVTFGNKKTSTTVPIRWKGQPLVFQTPFIEVIGTLRKTIYPDLYQMDTLFRGDHKKKQQQWYQFIENLETHISILVKNHGTKWFTEKNVNIKSLIRELDPDKGIFFIKWPIDLKTNIFIDEHKNLFNPANIKEKDQIKFIVEISDLWIRENQCGLAVIVQKALVKQYTETIPSEYVFDDTASDEVNDNPDNSIISLLATEQKTRPKTNPPTTQAQAKKPQNTDSDDDDEPRHPAKNERVVVGKKEPVPAQKVINKQTTETKTTKQKPPARPQQQQQQQQPNSKPLPIFNKDAMNPFRSTTQKKPSASDVYSDEFSDDSSSPRNLRPQQLNTQSKNAIKHLVEEYTPSSDDDDEMVEINDDDLEL